jgi:N-acetyl-beta-hexosaminidase
MSVVKTIKGDFYHIIEAPFDTKAEAEKLAKKRMKEYPAGKQKVVPSKDKKFWGVYEKVSYDHIPEQHRYPEGRKKK